MSEKSATCVGFCQTDRATAAPHTGWPLASMQNLIAKVKGKFAKARSADEELDRNVEEEIARNLWVRFVVLVSGGGGELVHAGART